MVILLNCSFRGEKSNSNYFLSQLEKFMSEPCKRKNLVSIKNTDDFAQELKNVDALVLGMPLYVDGVPAQVIELMEKLHKNHKNTIGNLRVYVVTNLGFYEGEQAATLLKITENWCKKMNFTYSGALSIGAGEMLAGLGSVPIDKGPNKMLGTSLKEMATHISNQTTIENTIVKPSGFSRTIYMLAGNMNWAPQAKKNGIKKKEIKNKIK